MSSQITYTVDTEATSQDMATGPLASFLLVDARRPKNNKVEPVSGGYPTNDYYTPQVNYAYYQYRPGRFESTGGGGSHTHTLPSSTTNISWDSSWNMNVKYIGAIFAKYTG